LLHCPFLGRTAPAITLPTAQGYTLHLVDSRSAQIQAFDPAVTTLVQLFIRGNPFRSGSGLSERALNCLQALGEHVQAVVVYGSPYVWQQIQAVLPAKTPSVFTYGQMKEAQAIALQPLLSPSEQPNELMTAAGNAFTD
jgi:beta-glucosidase